MAKNSTLKINKNHGILSQEKVKAVTDFLFLGSKIPTAMKLENSCFLEGSDKPRQHIQKQSHHFADNFIVKAMVFPVVL